MNKKQTDKLQKIYISFWVDNTTDKQKQEANKIEFFVSCGRMNYEEALIRLTLAKLNQIDLIYSIYKNEETLKLLNIINQ